MLDPVSVARSRLIIERRWEFFATLALYLKPVPLPAVLTAATDGENLYYNPAWFCSLKPYEQMAVVSHEVLHCALGHLWRRDARDPVRWNVACDYVVNAILHEAGMLLPAGSLYDPRFSGSFAEAVYEKIPPGCSLQPWGVHDLWPGNLKSGSQASQGSPPQASQAGLPEEWSSRLVSAASVARERGTLPAGVEVFVKAAKEPTVPWRQVLSEFLTRVRSGYTWHPFDRRFAYAGVYLPDFSSPGVEEIVVALDTSGSISDDELSQFLAEVKAIVDCDPLRLHVVLCDAAVWSWDVVEQGEPAPHVQVKGRGGTDFRPVFDEVQRRGVFPSALVYLTDGHGAYPELPPLYPVLWVLVSDYVPPFGARVRMYRV